MDTHKAALELQELMVDHGVTLLPNPYDARNLEDAITDFLDRFFGLAYSEGYAEGQESEENYHYDRGYDAGYDNGSEKGYEDAVNAVRGALDL